jgi:hypothetical protein
LLATATVVVLFTPCILVTAIGNQKMHNLHNQRAKDPRATHQPNNFNLKVAIIYLQLAKTIENLVIVALNYLFRTQ